MGGLIVIDLDMGAYAGFVWPAWAISTIALAALAARALIADRRWNAELKQLDTDTDADRAQTGQGLLAPKTRAQAVRSAVAPRK